VPVSDTGCSIGRITRLARPSVRLSVCPVRGPNSKTKETYRKIKMTWTFPRARVSGVKIFRWKGQRSRSQDVKNLCLFTHCWVISVQKYRSVEFTTYRPKSMSRLVLSFTRQPSPIYWLLTITAAGGDIELVAKSTVDAWSTDEGPDCVVTHLVETTQRLVVILLTFIYVCISNTEPSTVLAKSLSRAAWAHNSKWKITEVELLWVIICYLKVWKSILKAITNKPNVILITTKIRPKLWIRCKILIVARKQTE